MESINSCKFDFLVPKNCKEERLWQVERSLGSVLIDPMAIQLAQRMTRYECYEACLKKGTFFSKK